MANSGVKLDDKCVLAFNDFKLSHTVQYIIYGFSEDAKKIVVLHQEPKSKTTSEKNPDWSGFLEHFPAADVRYAVVDVDYQTKEGPKTNMMLIMWAPENASIKKRMLIASSQHALKNALVGCSNHMQAGCYADLSLNNVIGQFKGAVL
jgi:cofilin